MVDSPRKAGKLRKDQQLRQGQLEKLGKDLGHEKSPPKDSKIKVDKESGK